MGSDRICEGNEIIAGMNEHGVSKWKSCGNKIAINFILFDDYGIKYIDIYNILLQLVQKLV